MMFAASSASGSSQYLFASTKHASAAFTFHSDGGGLLEWCCVVWCGGVVFWCGVV